MATKLYFRNALATKCRASVVYTKKIGTGPYTYGALSTSKGAGVVTASRATVAGPTAGLELPNGTGIGSGVVAGCYVSEPIDADTTISGTITINIWAAESNMSANVAINCDIYWLKAADDTVVLIHGSARVTEVAVTTRAVNNFTGAATSAAMQKGDRIMAVIWMDDAGTMGSGETCTISMDGTTDGADGDSWISFTETFGFITTAPAGSVYYLRSTDETPVVSNRRSLALSTSRGSTALQWRSPFINPGLANGYDVDHSLDHDGRLYCIPVFSQIGERGVVSGAANLLDAITSTAHRDAQSFVMPSDASDSNIRRAYIGLDLIGPDDDGRTQIHTDDGAGNPGTVVASDTGGFLGPNLYFKYADDALTEGTTYWIVLRNATGASFSLQPRGNTSGTYANGNYSRSTNSGGSWTPSAGTDMNVGIDVGYPVLWYTPPLEAFTLSGLVKFYFRAQGSQNSSFSCWAELAVCDSDGTNATVWAIAGLNSRQLGVLTTTDLQVTIWFCGDDLSVGANQRIRLRICTTPSQAVGTITNAKQYVDYGVDGPTADAAGDASLTFTQTLVEASAGAALVLQHGFVNYNDPGIY